MSAEVPTTQELIKNIRKKAKSGKDISYDLHLLLEKHDLKSADFFIEMIKNPDIYDAWKRQEAIKILGKMGVVAAIPTLLETLIDANEEISWSSAVALGSIGNWEQMVDGLAPIVDNLDSTSRVGWGAFKVLEMIGVPSLPILTPLINHEDAYIRDRALMIIVAINHPDAVPTLIDIAIDPSQEFSTRHDAIGSLGKIGNIEALESLRGQINDGLLEMKIEGLIGELRT